MNENSSTHSTTSTAHHGLTAEAISRRAYELWEQEGRPESRDLHHWLRAEKELLAEQGQKSGGTAAAKQDGMSTRSVETAPAPASRSGTTAPAGTTNRNGTKPPSSRSTQPGMRTETMRGGRG
ncbi:MAG TPA: DUF2934 domain-containing protein [Opitutaceae bacterium]|nr:DUF2934 domain-containing protein [Opitutaceae bacterium]